METNFCRVLQDPDRNNPDGEISMKRRITRKQRLASFTGYGYGCFGTGRERRNLSPGPCLQEQLLSKRLPWHKTGWRPYQGLPQAA